MARCGCRASFFCPSSVTLRWSLNWCSSALPRGWYSLEIVMRVVSRLVIASYFMSSTLAWAGPMEDFKAAAAAQERGDYVTALRMFQALADQKIPGGLWAMGAMYAEGKGVTQDYAVAAKWYR